MMAAKRRQEVLAADGRRARDLLNHVDMTKTFI